MKKLSLSGILIFAAIIAASAISYSQQMNKPGRENMRGRMFEKLNLTDDQKSKIADLQIEHQKAMVDLRADLQKKRLDMKGLIHKGNFSRSDFLNLTKEVNDAKDKISTARANHMMDIYEMLTDQQKKMFSEMPMMRGGMRDGCRMMDRKGPMKRMPDMK